MMHAYLLSSPLKSILALPQDALSYVASLPHIQNCGTIKTLMPQDALEQPEKCSSHTHSGRFDTHIRVRFESVSKDSQTRPDGLIRMHTWGGPRISRRISASSKRSESVTSF